jgi:CheY-like chemotaxis protein
MWRACDAGARAHVAPVSALVLVVDDFADTREMYAEFLRFAGFGVLEAADGAQAVRLAKDHHPDAIVMDLSMPEMDGATAAEILKSDPLTGDIAIIAVTGHLDSPLADRARRICDGFCAKPCDPDLIQRELDRALGAARG